MRTLQKPIGSGFGAASTTNEVIRGIDLSGKTAIVTGGYSGLGREAARTLRSAGARVIVPARDQQKAASALAGIDVEIEPMDLVNPESIDTFVHRFLATGQPLHILVNSAGIMAIPTLTQDARGYELHFATNHLGHFQLAVRLWPALARGEGRSRSVCIVLGTSLSPVVLDDPNFERRHIRSMEGVWPIKNSQHSVCCRARPRGQKNGVRAFSLHPGSIVGTGLEKYMQSNSVPLA